MAFQMQKLEESQRVVDALQWWIEPILWGSQWLLTSDDGDASSTLEHLWLLNTIFYIISGVQACTFPLDEPTTVPRRHITSDRQYQSNSNDGSSPDGSVRSPIRCVSPEFVNAIAMNPGGRPKEVQNLHLLTNFTLFNFYTYLAFVCFLPLYFSPEKYAQLPGGLWGNGRRPSQSYGNSWWWGVSPNPCLPHLAANPLLQPV